MKRLKVIRFLITSSIITSMIIVMNTSIFSVTTGFSFTMDYEYVNGKNNGITYTLPDGIMTINGNIWVYSKDQTTYPNPLPVTIEVWDDDGSIFNPDDFIGSLTVQPVSTLDQKVPFNSNFGYVSPDDENDPGEYYIVAKKSSYADGYNLKGLGTLSTN